MNSWLEIDTVKLESITTELENKTVLVKEILSNINNEMKSFDGTNDMWKGKTQEVLYETYKSMGDKFPNIITQLENYNIFLRKTIENYNVKEKIINDSIENNSDNLDIN